MNNSVQNCHSDKIIIQLIQFSK